MSAITDSGNRLVFHLSACLVGLVFAVFAPVENAWLAACGAGVLFGIARAVVPSSWEVVCIATLGFLTPLVPGYFSFILLLFFAVFLVIPSSKHVDSSEIKIALPILALACVWVGSDIAFTFDIQQWSQIGKILRSHGSSLHEYLRRFQPTYVASTLLLCKYIVLLLLITYFREQRARQTSLLTGITVGICVATGITILQVYGFVPPILENSSEYWQALNRYSGSFSDPNAYGIFVVLLIPMCVAMVRGSSFFKGCLIAFVGILTVYGVLFAGSRSFLLGAGVYAAVVLHRFWGVKALLLLSLGVVSFVIGLNFVGGPPFIEWLLHLPGLPSGLRRVIETLALHHVEHALSSRVIMAHAASEMFLSNPFVGVGFGHFRDMLPQFAQIVGGDNQLWIDNANNFYLGLLAEFGLVGAALLVLLLCQIRFSKERDVYHQEARASCLVLAIVLVAGPHFEFEEVVVLSSLIISYAITTRYSKALQLGSWAIVLCALPFILNAQLHKNRGVYPIERTETGSEYFWTERVSQFTLPCVNGKAQFGLLALPFGEERTQVRVALDSKTFNLIPGEKHQMNLSCDSSRSLKQIQMEIDRIWIPAFFITDSRDYRPLGVQVWPGYAVQ